MPTNPNPDPTPTPDVDKAEKAFGDYWAAQDHSKIFENDLYHEAVSKSPPNGWGIARQLERERDRLKSELERVTRLTSRCCVCGAKPYRIFPVCRNHAILNAKLDEEHDAEKAKHQLNQQHERSGE